MFSNYFLFYSFHCCLMLAVIYNGISKNGLGGPCSTFATPHVYIEKNVYYC